MFAVRSGSVLGERKAGVSRRRFVALGAAMAVTLGLRPASHEYSSWAELEAAETEGVDYRLEVRRTDSQVSHIAIHGGGIEPGTSELASRVALATGGQYYALVGIKPSGNSDLHIASTQYDEPQCLDLQAAVAYTVSYHGLAGATPESHIGGLDTARIETVGRELEEAGFTVVYSTDEDVDGDDPANITNRNRNCAGVQLELTRAQRETFFPGGDLSRESRESGDRTGSFYTYAAAIARAMGPLD